VTGTIEQRVTELEIKLTFIDHTVRALADADADQSLRMAALERTLRDLRRELASLRLAQADDPHSEPPPPHY
jgi:SlyX protein